MSRRGNFRPTWGVEETQTNPGGGDGIGEAPDDGRQYVRVSGEWVPVPYATNTEVAEGTAQEKIVQPSNIGNLLTVMGIRYDEESESWINDQGDLDGGALGGGGLGDGGELP